jgi:hypothetical protein
MTFHRFAIGETVAANGFGIPPGPYRIVRLLPLAGGVPQYRAKSMVDEHERALAESDLRPAMATAVRPAEGLWTSYQWSRRKWQRGRSPRRQRHSSLGTINRSDGGAGKA